jgi:hypothetical protein
MTPRQCEVAAESHTASLLARSGYDVLVQYGANQPNYDLMADKEGRKLPISVKGSQDGGWMLAVKYKKEGVSYAVAAEKWLAAQRKDVLYVFVQFRFVPFGEAPRTYVASPKEIAAHLKKQHNGIGYGALQEDMPRDSPNSKYRDKIPDAWIFTKERIDSM